MKNIIFYIILFIIFIYYNIFEILQLPAQGAHLWRQADCLAMVWNFKQYNASFFLPQMYNLIAVDGKGVAEFPIFYYISSFFKNPELALRTLHFLILLFATYRIFVISNIILKNTFYALCTVIMLLSSPLIIFYGINFISDVPAFCCCIIALSYYFLPNRNTTQFLLFLIFLTLASLLKAPYFIYFMVILLLDYKKIKSYYLYTILFALLPILWYTYAIYINHKLDNQYYFLSSTPIYNMSFHEIGLAIWRMTISWSKTYFWRPTSILILIFFIRFIIQYPNSNLRKYALITMFITVFYILLFLQKLIIHEYYYAYFYVIFIIAIIILFYQLQEIKNQKMIKLFVIFFLFINVNYGKNYTKEKQKVQRIDNTLSTIEFQNFLLQNGCNKHKTVLCYDDISLNQQLYAIKRKGYTQYNNWQEKLKENKIDYIITNKNNSYTIINVLNSELRKFTKIEFKNYILIKM